MPIIKHIYNMKTKLNQTKLELLKLTNSRLFCPICNKTNKNRFINCSLKSWLTHTPSKLKTAKRIITHINT